MITVKTNMNTSIKGVSLSSSRVKIAYYLKIILYSKKLK